jgi:hypothetical protein
VRPAVRGGLQPLQLPLQLLCLRLLRAGRVGGKGEGEGGQQVSGNLHRTALELHRGRLMMPGNRRPAALIASHPRPGGPRRPWQAHLGAAHLLHGQRLPLHRPELHLQLGGLEQRHPTAALLELGLELARVLLRGALGRLRGAQQLGELGCADLA